MPQWEIGLLFLSSMIASYLLSLRMGKTSAKYLRIKPMSEEEHLVHAFALIGTSCVPFLVLAYFRLGNDRSSLLLLLCSAMATGAIGYYRGKRVVENGK